MATKFSVDVQSLIDAQNNPFVLIDDNYTIVAANTAYRRAFGIIEQDVTGRKCHQVSHLSAVPCHMNGKHCPHRQVFETHRPCEVMHLHCDMHARPEFVRINGSAVLGSDGSVYLGETFLPLKPSVNPDFQRHPMIGKSQAFRACREKLTQAAESDSPVFLCGEDGVGKTLAAEYIHDHSKRSSHAFRVLDCSKIPQSALERELFGREADASTGSAGRRYGLLEQADGGTLLLKGIGGLPHSLQARLLHVMQTGRFQPGAGRDRPDVDVRLICTSTEKLRERLAGPRFSTELYQCITGLICEIPALRERRTDVPDLAHTLIQRINTPENQGYRLSDDAVEALLTYDYPGNVRELGNILRAAVALSRNGIITAQEIPIKKPFCPVATRTGLPIAGQNGHKPSIKGLEQQYMTELLAQHHGKRSKVAQILGISERTLYRKLKRYGLQSIGKTG